MLRNRSPLSQKKDAKVSVLGRISDLPLVKSWWDSIQNIYTNTKEKHPLIASVLNVYEKGAKAATSLGAWSMKPVVDILQPQINAANNLACAGLDILEEKIPALHYSPEKIASEFKEAATSIIGGASRQISNVRSRAKSLVASPSESTVSAATTSSETGRDMTTGMTKYIYKPVSLTGQGIGMLLNKAQGLADYVLPNNEGKKVDSTSKEKGSEVPAEEQGSIIWRAGFFASIAIKQSYKQTSNSLQQTMNRGLGMVSLVPNPFILNSKAFSMIQDLTQNLQAATVSGASKTMNLLPSLLKPVEDVPKLIPTELISGASDQINTLRNTVKDATNSTLKNIFAFTPLPGLIPNREDKTSNDAESDHLPAEKEEDDKGKISHDASSSKTTDPSLLMKTLGQLPSMKEAIQKGPLFMMEEVFKA